MLFISHQLHIHLPHPLQTIPSLALWQIVHTLILSHPFISSIRSGCTYRSISPSCSLGIRQSQLLDEENSTIRPVPLHTAHLGSGIICDLLGWWGNWTCRFYRTRVYLNGVVNDGFNSFHKFGKILFHYYLLFCLATKILCKSNRMLNQSIYPQRRPPCDGTIYIGTRAGMAANGLDVALLALQRRGRLHTPEVV